MLLVVAAMMMMMMMILRQLLQYNIQTVHDIEVHKLVGIRDDD